MENHNPFIPLTIAFTALLIFFGFQSYILIKETKNVNRRLTELTERTDKVKASGSIEKLDKENPVLNQTILNLSQDVVVLGASNNNAAQVAREFNLVAIVQAARNNQQQQPQQQAPAATPAN
ncbi:MAG: hypothetical protein SGI71_12765 [Verrucomicrobiota bacterium]|nr:hypothetical protein [Verrucomicrobiota bacterium]